MAGGARDRVTLSRQVAAHAARLQSALERRIITRLAEHGMTKADFDVLAALDAGPALRPKEISDRLLLTTGGLSNVLRRLESAGLLTRAGDAEDRRGQRVTITAAGRRAITAADTAVTETIDGVLAPVDHATLTAVLRTLHATLTALGEDEAVHRFLDGRRPPPAGSRARD